MIQQTRFNVKNCMEEVVANYLNDSLRFYDGLCKCEKCQNDIYALVLNSLPPKYAATDLGEKYAKITMLDSQFRVEVFTAISVAVDIIKNNPRHDRESVK